MLRFENFNRVRGLSGVKVNLLRINGYFKINDNVAQDYLVGLTRPDQGNTQLKRSYSPI